MAIKISCFFFTVSIFERNNTLIHEKAKGLIVNINFLKTPAITRLISCFTSI